MGTLISQQVFFHCCIAVSFFPTGIISMLWMWLHEPSCWESLDLYFHHSHSLQSFVSLQVSDPLVCCLQIDVCFELSLLLVLDVTLCCCCWLASGSHICDMGCIHPFWVVHHMIGSILDSGSSFIGECILDTWCWAHLHHLHSLPSCIVHCRCVKILLAGLSLVPWSLPCQDLHWLHWVWLGECLWVILLHLCSLVLSSSTGSCCWQCVLPS
jgi:hypothetical protein